jgi:hypothetical protein
MYRLYDDTVSATAWNYSNPPNPNRTVIGNVNVNFDSVGSIADIIVYSDMSMDIICNDLLSGPIDDFIYQYENYLQFVPDANALAYMNHANTDISFSLLVALPTFNDYANKHQYLMWMIPVNIYSQSVYFSSISDWGTIMDLIGSNGAMPITSFLFVRTQEKK